MHVITSVGGKWYFGNLGTYFGNVLWNIASSYYTDNLKLFYAKIRKGDFIKQSDFNKTLILSVINV